MLRLYIYGLGLANALIESGQARKVLLLTADTYSKLTNPAEQKHSKTIRHGGTASLVLAHGEETSIRPFVYGTDGSGAANLIVSTGGARRPLVPQAELASDDSGNARTVNDLYMNGTKIFKFTLRMVPEAVMQLLSKAGITQEARRYIRFPPSQSICAGPFAAKAPDSGREVRYRNGNSWQHCLFLHSNSLAASA